MKKIFALILVLVLALAVFSSCGKKEEAKPTSVEYKIYNRSGIKIDKLTIGNSKDSSAISTENITDGTDFGMTYTNPNDGSTIQIRVKAGDVEITTGVPDAAKDITIEAGPNVSFSAPAK